MSAADRSSGGAGAALAPTPVAIVILTHNRREELLRTLGRLVASHPDVPLCVVDNASGDGSTAAVAAAFPRVRVVRAPRNLGAAGRNLGVTRVDARYVAFCDDDTWWAPGALTRAAEVLDAHPRLAAVTARVLVGETDREDPTSTFMAASPLPNVLGHPGTPAWGFLAGACVMRRSAFIAAGGYEPRLFIGGEERLLALDLLAAGWHLAYLPDIVVHHHPSPRRDRRGRRGLLLRNALWCAWLRRAPASAWKLTWRQLELAAREPGLAWSVLAALRGIPWVLARRRTLPPHLEALLRDLEEAQA